MEIYEKLLQVQNQVDLNPMEEIGFLGTSRIPVLEKSKLYPIGKRRMRINRDGNFVDEIVDLRDGNLIVLDDYSIKETLDDEISKYSHDYIEEYPNGSDGLNSYVSQRLKDKEKIPENVERGVYGSLYDVFDAMTELNDPVLNPESLQKLYQFGKGLIQTKKPIAQVSKTKKKLVDSGVIIEKLNDAIMSKKKMELLKIVGNWIMIQNFYRRKMILKKRPRVTVIHPLPNLEKIQVSQMIDYLNEIVQMNFRNYVEDLCYHVWNTCILNGNLKSELIRLKNVKPLSEIELTLFFLNIINRYAYFSIWKDQKRVISAIYLSYTNSFPSKLVGYLKEIYVNEEWREITGFQLKNDLLNHLKLQEIDYSAIHGLLEKLLPKLFLKSARNFPVILPIRYPFIDETKIRFKNNIDVLKNFNTWIEQLQPSSTTFHHLILYLNEFHPGKLYKMNGSFLKFYLVSESVLLKKSIQIMHNHIVEYHEKNAFTLDHLPLQNYANFLLFLRQYYPLDSIFILTYEYRLTNRVESQSRNANTLVLSLFEYSLFQTYLFHRIYLRYIHGITLTPSRFISLISQ